MQGPAGTEIRLRHAEVLEHGELGTRPLRDAQATDRFILSGDEDFFEPTKTFHGFRYAEVSGWPGELTLNSLEAVVVGATTIWERWDSMLPDGTINPGAMTSFNHYALGAVADFLHRVVAGLAPAEPGYRTIRVAPRPGGGLTSAWARLMTPRGEAAVAWRRDGETLTVDVTVPAGRKPRSTCPGATRPSSTPERTHSRDRVRPGVRGAGVG